MFKQTNENNLGLDPKKKFPGFDPNDSTFDETHPAHTMQESLAKWIIKEYPNVKTILDVGCAAGSLGFFLRKLAPELTVIGLEGNWETANSPFIEKESHFIVRTDQPYEIVDENGERVKFDLIVSFEHLEHIQKDTFDVFADNIENHSKEGTIFFATAAMWNDPARPHVHCNVQGRGSWDKYFKDRGWEKLDEPVLTGAVRNKHWESRLRGSHEVRFKVRSRDL